MDNEGSYWVHWLEEECGVDTYSQLTMKILEDSLEDLLFELGRLKEGINRADDGYATITIGYQILALFLLEAGAYVPEVVKEEVLFSTTMEYDKRWWGSDPDDERMEFMDKLRDGVSNQVPGKKYKF